MPAPVSNSARSPISALLAPIAAIALIVLSACGGSSSGGGGGTTPPPINTSVTVLLSSTANDALTNFGVNIQSIALTNKAGTAVSVYSSPQPNGSGTEFITLNGAVEPFTTAQIPEGTYTAATITLGGCVFTNVYAASGSLNIDIWDEGTCSEGTGTSTVNLVAPIAISGNAMALELNLQVAQSFTLNLEPTGSGLSTYTIDPVFSLSPVTISAAPSSIANGRILSLNGSVSSVSATANNFTLLLSDGTMLTAKANTATVYQGVSQLSDLAAPQTANVDLSLQTDGSLVATRVEVDNTSTSLINAGFWLTLGSTPALYDYSSANEQIGCSGLPPQDCGGLYGTSASTAFLVSGEFDNFASLPFSPSFSLANSTPGQFAAAAVTDGTNDQNIPDAIAITLQPQTINGTVQAVTNVNGVAQYTVVLAPYDIFAATQTDYPPGQQTLTNPNTVVVYADSSAQFLHTVPIEEGDLLRFRGVIFNDGGTLRMDCNEILDGVTE